EFV
ncbi:CAI-1 autoinducer synthase, partial [Vibrio parahaemolyticus EKP-008]